MILYPQGQLGNQLFGLACALYFSERESGGINLLLSDEDLYKKIVDTVLSDLEKLGVKVQFCKNKKTFLDYTYRGIEKIKLTFKFGNNYYRLLSRVFLTLERPEQSYRTMTHKQLKSLVVRGYFQDTSMINNLSEMCQSVLFRVINSKSGSLTPGPGNTLGVHIRRGDYAQIPSYGTLSLDYFQGIIHEESQSLKLLILASDDAETIDTLDYPCKTRRLYPDKNSPINTMEILAESDVFIMSNSTFSFWIGWAVVFKGGRVIAPEPWFKQDSISRDYLYINSFERRKAIFD